MMGRACRPAIDEGSRCVIMCPQVRKPFLLKFVQEGLRKCLLADFNDNDDGSDYSYRIAFEFRTG